MKIFLQGGGGGRKESGELDKKFISALDLSKPLLYIPIAIEVDRYPYPTCLNWIKNLFSPLGVNNIVMWIEEDLKGKTFDDFKQFGGVYIGGGNTFKLLKELKEFGTFDILRKLIEQDIPVAGGSAGAIILAKSIIPALSADSNDVGLEDFSAMNLVQDCEVWCHYNSEMDKEILDYKEKYKFGKIIAIPENAGLYVTESSIEEIGPGIIKYF